LTLPNFFVFATGTLARKIYGTQVKEMAEKKPQSLEVEFKLRKENEEANRIQVLSLSLSLCPCA
jgi:GTP cyclohydrolase FolE2